MHTLVSFLSIIVVAGQVAAVLLLSGERRGIDSAAWRSRNMSRAERARWAERSMRAARANDRGIVPW